MKIPRTLGRYEVLDLIGRGGMVANGKHQSAIRLATLTGFHSVDQEPRRGNTRLVWLSVAAAVVLLLIVLGMLYRSNRSSRRGTYPVESAGPRVLARSTDPRMTAHRRA